MNDVRSESSGTASLSSRSAGGMAAARHRGFRAVAARGLTQRPQRLGRGERGCG
jgi:hypothetical protein